jgi:hypothetical protein
LFVCPRIFLENPPFGKIFEKKAKQSPLLKNFFEQARTFLIRALPPKISFLPHRRRKSRAAMPPGGLVVRVIVGALDHIRYGVSITPRMPFAGVI